MKITRIVLAITILCAMGAGFVHWNRPGPADISLRSLASGDVIGFEDAGNTLAWLGIPFAQPPVGELRWRAPRPAQRWEGVREALRRSPMCPQFVPLNWLPLITVGQEDCLHLNVWTPRLSQEQARDSRIAVMVWIHGGGNTLGGSSAAEPYRFAREENLVVVSLQYRLGLLGWFSHPALRDTAPGQSDVTSNFALLDQVAALQWVQDNIAQFGGDPDNVTIFGQSAGAFNVMALLATPQAEGLFHRAIAQSGYLHTTPQAQAENYIDAAEPGLLFSSREYINKLLINDGLAAGRDEAKRVQNGMSAPDLVDYLSEKPVKELFESVDRAGAIGYLTPSNIRDGIVLPQAPLMEVFSQPGQYNSVPIILGSNRDEFKLWLWSAERFSDKRFGVLPRVRDLGEYNRIAGYFSDHWQATGVNEPARVLHRSQPGQVYAYRFDWAEQPTKAGVKMADLFGAAHGIEVAFLFGREAVKTIPLFAMVSDQHSWDVLSEAMLGYWARFARTGDPGSVGEVGSVQWMPWQNDGARKMVFDSIRSGGIHMTEEAEYVDDLKARLRQDTAIESDRERCKLYAQLFLLSVNSDFWDEGEYLRLGCAAYPPEAFDAMF
jgi:para-nitrobenzyl esterase